LGIIQKQGIQNTIVTYVGIGVGFVSLIFIQPHLLTTEVLGLVRILIAAGALIATILPLGVSNVNTRFFPYFRNKELGHHGYFGFMLLFPLAGLLVCSVLLFFFKDVFVGLYQENSALFVNYFPLVLPLAVCISITVAVNSYSASLFRSVFPAFIDGVVNKLLMIIVCMIFYSGLITLDTFILSVVWIYLLQWISVVVYLYNIDKPSFRVDWKKVRAVGLASIIRYGLLLTLTAMSSVSLKYLDTLMLGKYVELDYVGIFAVTAFIATVIEAPLNSLERIANNKVAQAWADRNKEEIGKIYDLSVRYMMLVGGLLLVGILVNLEDLLKLLPKDYSLGIGVTVILSISAFINVSTGINNAIIFTSDKYKYGSLFLFILLAVAIICNITLIPLWGIEGAAMSTAIASIIYNLLKFFFIWLRFGMQPYDIASLKNILLIGLCFGIWFILPVPAQPLVAIIVKSVVIGGAYIAGAYFLRIAPELHKQAPFIGKWLK
jgi:O-antigen/teichoic acid export membrane protein